MLDERICYQFRRCKVIKFAWKIFFFLRSLESILLRVLKYYLLKYSKLCVYFNLKKLSYKFLRHFFDFVCQMNRV